MKTKEELNAYAREWRAKNKEKLSQRAKEKYANNPEHYKAKMLKSILKHREANPNANRNKHYKKRYGITVEQYEAMAKQQNYLCAICNNPETKKRKDGTTMILCVDHNHTTGKVRELLCNKCNIFLGHLETNNVSLDAVAAYIERHK